MTRTQSPFRKIAVAALLCAAGAANAGIVFANSSAAIPGAVTDAFSNLTINTFLGTSVPRSAGSLQYTLGSTVTNPDSGLFVVPIAGNVGVSTNWSADSLTFGFTSQVFAFGGNFFATNVLGELTSGGMTISVTDTSGTSLSQTLAGNSLTGFAGFRSDLPLASATVRLTSASTDRWASADNVVLSAVPEPQSLALVVLAGAIMLTVPALRRR